jgi:hypothetical protein
MTNELRAFAVMSLLGAFAAMGDEPTAEDILKGEAGPIDYSQSVKCIASYKIQRTEPLSDRYILFHLDDGSLWLAQLRARCAGVAPDAHLAFEQKNNRLCEWDSVRVLYDDAGPGGVMFGPKCNLPKFDPVSTEQVEMLKEQIRKPTRPSGASKP